jgi:hypothetical protein
MNIVPEALNEMLPTPSPTYTFKLASCQEGKDFSTHTNQ